MDLSLVPGLAFNHEVVPDLAQLDAGVGKGGPKFVLDQGQVGENRDLERISFIPRGRDRQVGHADTLADEPDLPRVDHGKVEDRRVADGNQRPVRPGRDILLEVEDPRLVDEHLERGVIAAQAVGELLDRARALGRPRLGKGQLDQAGRILALLG